MLNLRSGAAALVILTCAVSGCKKPAAESKTGQEQAAQPTTGAATPLPEPVKPVPETIPPVVARVNGEGVPKAHFDRMLKQIEMQAGQPVPKERRDEIYRKVLDQLVTDAALVQEARARGIQVTDAEANQVAEKEIARLRAQIPDEAAFKKALADRDITLERLRTDIRQALAVSKMMQAELSTTAGVSDAEVREFYDKNPDEFTGVRASHILIKTEGMDEAAKKQARAAIEDVLKQAKAGTDFAELAKKHSSDGSAQNGGDLGFFTKGRMVPEFSNAAFALQPGQISDVVETQYGYHIIKVTERKDVPFTEASEKIRGFLAAKRQTEQQQAFVASIKNKAKIEVLF